MGVACPSVMQPPDSASQSTCTASDAGDVRPQKRMRQSEPRRLCEHDVGLLTYVHPDWRPVHAIIKQRYADFLVREIAPDGQVVRITSLDPPGDSGFRSQAPSKDSASWDDLLPYFGEEQLAQLRSLCEHGPVDSRVLADKTERTQIHRLVRALAGDSLVSDTVVVESGAYAGHSTDAAPASVVRVQKQTWGSTSCTSSSSSSSSSAPVQSSSSSHSHSRPRSRANADPDSEAMAAPPYIHFTLQKTNRDSQEALQWLARFLKLDHRGRSSSANMLSVAGTKDKRAVTVQRVALQRGRRTLHDVWHMVNHIGQPVSSAPGDTRRRSVTYATTTRAERGLRIAHLSYADAPLQLGMLNGNEFTITLRDVRWADTTELGSDAAELRAFLATRVQEIQAHGFINYFGMQRFGTGFVSTHRIGIAVLCGDYHEALHLILDAGAMEDGSNRSHGSGHDSHNDKHVPTQPRHDAENDDDDDDGAPPAVLASRQAQAAVRDQRYHDAYRLMPKKCVAERAVLEKMKAPYWSPTDPLGAFQNIPRSLRLMYVHAYQSYVWNRLVSERVRRFGALKPVVGDLVLVNNMAVELDEQSVSRYTMQDVVMPMPGADVHLPPNGWLASMYEDILREDGLTPSSLSSSAQPEYRLKGAYRRMLQMPQHLRHTLLAYNDANATLCATDEEVLLPDHGTQGPGAVDVVDKDQQAPFLALQLTFELPPSSYATVMLRELLRTDTSAHLHKELTKQSIDASS